MARFLIIAAVLIASAFADDGYAAPSQGYSAPSTGYGTPQDTGYAAPSSYDAPTGYDDQVSYAATAPADGELFNLDKLITLIPFFLAVLAAIIIAQIIAPLFGLLFDAKVGLIAPLGGSSIDLINAVLTPLNLSICTVTPLAVATGRDAEGRSASGFNIDPATVSMLSSFAYNAFEKYSA